MNIGDFKHLIETHNLPDDMEIVVIVSDGRKKGGEYAKTAIYDKNSSMNFTHNITPFNKFQLNCKLEEKEDTYPLISFRKKQ